MNHLKITSPGFETYSGNLGGIDFIDGMSVNPVPRTFADRLSAAMRMVEVDEQGNEVPAGVAYRLVEESARRAPILDPLERQTEEERQAELAEAAKKKILGAVVINTRDELEAILEKGGIKALREISDRWQVKHRNAVALLELVLEAQAKYLETHGADAAGEPEAEGDADEAEDADDADDAGEGDAPEGADADADADDESAE